MKGPTPLFSVLRTRTRRWLCSLRCPNSQLAKTKRSSRSSLLHLRSLSWKVTKNVLRLVSTTSNLTTLISPQVSRSSRRTCSISTTKILLSQTQTLSWKLSIKTSSLCREPPRNLSVRGNARFKASSRGSVARSNRSHSPENP